MNKIIILLMVLLISISSVSAFEVLSSSNIEFDSNNDLYKGPAFVVLGVENGGQDSITWTMNNFADEMDDDYIITKSGTITSTFDSHGWMYSTELEGYSYKAKKIGTKFFLPWDDSGAWCVGEGGDFTVPSGSYSSDDCIEILPKVAYYSLNQGKYEYDVEYELNIFGKGIEKLKLTETSSTASNLIGHKNWFQVTITTHGDDIF